MKIQTVSILTLAATLLVFLIVTSMFFSTILLASYSDLEKQYVQKDLDEAVDKLYDELYTMSSIASDWGPWDDTVEFINGRDPNYLHSNLQPYGFDNLNLNIMAFVNTQGEIIFSGSYDLQKKKMGPIPPFFTNHINPDNPLMNMSDPHQVTTGILMLPENPLLVVSQPIVHSNYTGSPQGAVIMGRYLNTEEISRLAMLTQPTLTFTRFSDFSLSHIYNTQSWEKSGKTSSIIRAVDADQITGYALIRDIYGDDALVLQITEPRTIYHQGMNTTIQVILIILVGGLFMGFGFFILLNHKVLRRTASLAHQVHSIAQSSATPVRIKVDGDDELSDLGREINQMMDTIEQYSGSLQQANIKLRLLTGLTRHDIQNKLTSMQSFLFLAMEEPDTRDTKEYISRASLAGRKMESIIAFTREYENFGNVAYGWHNLRQIIDSALVEIPLDTIAAYNQIPESIEIYTDPIIRKVFSTLMENSIRHGEKVTCIQFSCLEKDRALIIIFTDNGVGIPNEEKEYIFEQGYGKHTGLGLFLSREILSVTGLTIRECGEPGLGARFEISVPEGKYKKKESNIEEFKRI